MIKFLTLLIFGILIYSSANGTTVNCSNGECEFNYSNHYKYAKTYCLQTLHFEQVETQTLSFTILKTGQECKVTESRQKN